MASRDGATTIQPYRSWTMRVLLPTTPSLIRATPGPDGRRHLTAAELRSIAERKLPDLSTVDIEAAMRAIAGTARSMGITITAR